MRFFWRVFFICAAGVIGLIALVYFGVFGYMPSMRELENPTIQQATEVYASDGTLMGKYYLPSGNRTMVRYKEISSNVINSLLATEDKRFYEHAGIDFKGTMRAVMLLGSDGGGSTITQQLALALFNQRSSNKATRLIQKLKEWIIAVKLEKNFTKEEIVALYLNAVPFSENQFGIRNASKTFFQKEPSQLNVEESALLVGMINGPGVYNPRRNPKAALDRRNLVITRLAEKGDITPQKAEALKAKPIVLNYKKMDENTGYAPYFREVLRDEIKTILKTIKKTNGDAYDIYNDGLKVYTTINPRMQEYAEEAVAMQMPVLQRALNGQGDVRSGSVWKLRENVLEAAMKQSDRWQSMAEDGFSDKEIKASFYKKVPMKIFAWNKNRAKDTVMTPYDSIKYCRQMVQSGFMAMDPITGEVKAWVGGIDFKTFKYDHVNLNTKRQVGSTIKPLLYTQAMEERGFTPETTCEASAQFFPGYGYVPAGKGCRGGTMPMASALAFSNNCASAYIMKQVGAGQFADFVSRLNVPTKLKAYPSNALGACELSLFEMMWAYTIFGGRGFSTKPYFISRIEDRNGNVIARFDFNVLRKEAVSELTAYTMARMMEGTVTKGTAKGLMQSLGAAELGGKTGTTNDNSDAWFMGYSPQLLAGVWVGNDDRFIRNQSKAFFGGTAAAPIWKVFFQKVYGDRTLGIDKNAKFEKPSQQENQVNSADIMQRIDNAIVPDAVGEDQGVGTEEDYNMDNNEYIGPESKPVEDPDAKPATKQPEPIKKDSIKENKPATDAKIGEPTPEKKEKKGLLNKLFNKKEKNKTEQ